MIPHGATYPAVTDDAGRPIGRADSWWHVFMPRTLSVMTSLWIHREQRPFSLLRDVRSSVKGKDMILTKGSQCTGDSQCRSLAFRSVVLPDIARHARGLHEGAEHQKRRERKMSYVW